MGNFQITECLRARALLKGPPEPQTAAPHGTVRFLFTWKHLRRGWTHWDENNFLQPPSRAGDRKTENCQQENKDQW